MKERDYIAATNKAKVCTAMAILTDVMPDINSGHDYGISEEELLKIMIPLSEAQEKLYARIKTEED